MPFHVYILRCADASYYVGHTDALDFRLAQHHSGELAGYTHSRRPLDLMWTEAFQTRIDALEAERRIKGWSRAKKEALIRGDWSALERLARRVSSFETAAQPAASRPPQDQRGKKADRDSTNSVRPEEGLSESEAPSRRTHAANPVIVLVRPQLGENIGKAARAMLNFGLVELRLVAPRDGWPNPDAGPAASGADSVLEQARVFDTLTDAIADCTHVYATTVRRRGLVKPVVTPETAAQAIVATPGRAAILFGPERSGLDTDDVAVAGTILTVPINPEFGSLNLAQAVILVAYEWSKHQGLAIPPERDIDPPAPQAELDGLIAHLESMLGETGYFFPPARVPATRRTLRSVLTKPGWNANEVRTLRGVLSALRGKRNDLFDPKA